VHSDRVNGAQRRRRDRSVGRCHARTRPQQARTKRCRTSLCGECRRGRRRGWWSEVTALEPCAARKIGWLTGGAGLLAVRRRERAKVRESWRVGSGGSERGAHAERAGGREGAGRRWAERGGSSRARGERGREYGPEIGPARGKVSLFFISYFHFLFLFLLSPFFLNN
jgi:hypothetical protein